jgi:signal transduction histidine kinase
VFINIITNGIEAMEDGGTITVSTKKLSNNIEIRISDEGVGIKEEDILHIFEPFFTTRDRGSGLGLAISYKVVEAHKGEIWADSEPGQGTTFVVKLPLL